MEDSKICKDSTWESNPIPQKTDLKTPQPPKPYTQNPKAAFRIADLGCSVV